TTGSVDKQPAPGQADAAAQRVHPIFFDRIRRSHVEGWDVMCAASAIGPGEIVLNAQHYIGDLLVAADRAADQRAAHIKGIGDRKAGESRSCRRSRVDSALSPPAAILDAEIAAGPARDSSRSSYRSAAREAEP